MGDDVEVISILRKNLGFSELSLEKAEKISQNICWIIIKNII